MVCSSSGVYFVRSVLKKAGKSALSNEADRERTSPENGAKVQRF
jgi:hypothetical protein